MYQRYPIALRQPHERFDFFQEVVTQIFCPMHIETDRSMRGSFNAALETVTLEDTHMVRVATSPLAVRRRAQDIARIDDPPYLVKFQIKGESLWTQRGREVHAKPGDFIIGSTAEPYTLTFKGYYEMPVLVVSRSVMRRLTPEPDRFLGRKLCGDDADCALLSNFVAQAALRMNQLSGHMARRVEASILDLLGGVLSERDHHGPITRTQQLTQIKQYIANHLQDRELTPATISRHFGVSTRSIHAIFEGEGTSISKYIRKLRVAGCRKAVENARAGQWSLTDLAVVWGFYDLSHMTRCFREEYGAPPGQFVARERHD
ncbi:helix-turn-helix domain-containing protein [Steroidobacter sp.]|uniref:AraC-like ligand-binding domain-containing protein n=1 Tax=Steroidobacter sp. TaxID=1978227 RepID=UPI001A55BE50|nr:helix-turn-helix domain-containing protein [Steroidobacter sp.]MBL8267562.1 helix-turn-helix domain-containing protein [Steroidobacter sp.]